MKIPSFALSLALALLSASASEPSKTTQAPPKRPLISSELDGKDLEFLQTAKRLSVLQKWLGDEAAKAETDQIKAVGGALKAAQEDEDKLLDTIAAQKGVNFPTDNRLPADLRKLAEQFGSLKGPKFDKAVLDHILSANQQEAATIEAATHSKDEDIKMFAERVLPLSKEKLQLAQKVTGTAPRTNVTPTFRTGTPTPTPGAE
jgi:predicted outer membrane protein